jgi:hypothetical protein
MNDKRTDGVDYEYNVPPNKSEDTLTASCISYLRDKGLTVYKATNPLVIYEDRIINMQTFLMLRGDINEAMDEVYEKIVIKNPKIVLVHSVKQTYNFISKDVAVKSNLSFDDSCVDEYRYIRYGVIENE